MSRKQINILRMFSLRGPSIWAYRPLLEVWVDIGELEDYPSNLLPGFNDRLATWLPGLVEHRCSVGERGGFLQRLRDGTWPAHILEHVALELQTLAGFPGGLGRARETSVRGVYKVVVRAWCEPLTREAVLAARDLVMAAIEDHPYDVDAVVEKLRDIAADLRLGPSTEAIVNAADDRDIPMIRLSDEHNLVQLGYGAAQRRIWTAETDQTSAIAEGVAGNKDLTRKILGRCGVPVPEGQEVDTVDEAWEVATDLGLPVVVKPTDGNHGRGVFTNLTTREEIETAYAVAVDEGSGVLVERFIPGDEHRLLVVGDQMVAAARGDAVSVVGDGVNTIEALIELQINADPRRGRDETQPLNIVRLDSAARLEIGRQGYNAQSVPAAGKRVLIQRNGNVSIDVTDKVHPTTRDLVVLAARAVGLDIAGIDLVVSDIALPLSGQGGAIVEVNAGPGLLMHLKPSAGEAQPVGEAIINHLFPGDANGQIPLVGITGSRGKTTVSRILTHLLRLQGYYVGLACSDGLVFDRRLVSADDCDGWDCARRILLNPAVQAAVVENGARTILTEGLAYERCRVGVITGIEAGETLPDLYIEDADQLFKVYRTQIDVVQKHGVAVLNADDPAVLEMADLCDGSVVLFGMSAGSEAIVAHRANSGRAVVAKDGWILMLDGAEQSVLTELAMVPVIDGATSPVLTQSVLAAVAAAWSLGVQTEVIRAGIQTYGHAASEGMVQSGSAVSPSVHP
ncbi:cyanophycin synthetase [Pusillimonas sp. NJUB218]|uniref:cyanophycin synthetase n=1 Tax=Pusillimonas sp. NJUB218 TaxID=2023230 RepID=UPI000F4B5D77|nr:cyanophycin synthetase [Pusillimonas sp. NJUB218]ROT46511.1 cyanophycin synthetase [Pusillimonas sp. NJUB218]